MIELMVVLLILGMIASIGSAALWSLRPPAPSVDRARADSARRKAIWKGHPVRLLARRGDQLLFLPDGQGRGQGADPLTGRWVPPDSQ